MMSDLNVFSECTIVNNLLDAGKEDAARGRLILLLDHHRKNRLRYDACVNHLIRATGLYPYLQLDSACWQDRFAWEAFRTDVGEAAWVTLHREQSDLLRMLLNGDSIAVSAPTSFGKTFVIDAYIAVRHPKNVMIIVPTIALMDEVRRRLQRKFGAVYKVITTTDATLEEQNLLVFPQERAPAYAKALQSLDLLVVDEFYKASSEFDSDRSPALVKAILMLGKLARQRYYLAPNISVLREGFFTRGMQFVDKLGFNTVALREHRVYRELGSGNAAKCEKLLELLTDEPRKTLIYAAQPAEIDRVVEFLTKKVPKIDSGLLTQFSDWLLGAYGPHWRLPDAVLRGVGIHTGKLHRSLSQLQIRVFEEDCGLNAMVSTSSIIEGVNTSAEAVVLWKSRRGGRGRGKPLDIFTYRNIVGRAGRMFKYFVGDVYLLEKPPEDAKTQLSIDVPEGLLGGMDSDDYPEGLSEAQSKGIESFRDKMSELVGANGFEYLFGNGSVLQSDDCKLLLKIAECIKAEPHRWTKLAALNIEDPDAWTSSLFELVKLSGGAGARHGTFVSFVKMAAGSWHDGVPMIVSRMRRTVPDFGVDAYFGLEKYMSYNFAALVHDVNELQKLLLGGTVDVAPFASRLAHAFLPSVVFQLEEYGLPRMIARKLQVAGAYDFERPAREIHSVLGELGKAERRLGGVPSLSLFDRYVLQYFFDGISPSRSRTQMLA